MNEIDLMSLKRPNAIECFNIVYISRRLLQINICFVYSCLNKREHWNIGTLWMQLKITRRAHNLKLIDCDSSSVAFIIWQLINWRVTSNVCSLFFIYAKMKRAREKKTSELFEIDVAFIARIQRTEEEQICLYGTSALQDFFHELNTICDWIKSWPYACGQFH